MSKLVLLLTVVAVFLGSGVGGYSMSMSPVQDGSMVVVHQHQDMMARDSVSPGTCDDCQERHLTAGCAMAVSHCSGLMASQGAPFTGRFATLSPYLAAAGDFGQGIEPEASSPPPRV